MTCPTLIPGVDVSTYQGDDIDWYSVSAWGGYAWAILKISEGVRWKGKSWCYEQAPRARDNLELGIAVYHYATPGRPDRRQDALDEAYDCLDAIAELEKHLGHKLAPIQVKAPDGSVFDLPQVWLDLEDGKATKATGMNPAEYTLWARSWVEAARREGYGVGIYGGRPFLGDWLLPDHDLGDDCELWIPRYGQQDQGRPATPGDVKPARGWADWRIHQWTSRGKVPGIKSERVDLNVLKVAA